MRALKNKRVLITCGPTWVPIDAMRVISNRSTGVLGQKMAEDFARAGAKVTLLQGPAAQRPLPGTVKVLKFTFFDEFAALIKKEAKKNYTVCLHAAAVSDYKLEKPASAKLSSQHSRLTLKLVATKKIIRSIKKWNPKLFLVGFKYEPKITKTSAPKKTRELCATAGCDLVVANSTGRTGYKGYVLDKHGRFLARAASRPHLSRLLVTIVEKSIR